jgi:hypothetical protein
MKQENMLKEIRRGEEVTGILINLKMDLTLEVTFAFIRQNQVTA